MNSDKDLLLELKKGSAKAFELLYKEQFRVIASLINKMGGSQSDIEDIFQETLFVLVKKIREPDFELTAKISTLMYAIARNLWLKRNQKESKVTNVSEDELLKMQFEKMNESDDYKEKELMIAVVLDNINTLEEECRKVIKLSFFKKMTHSEIAEELGYTTSFVKVKKFRCLGYLRKLVSDSPFFKFQHP